MKADTLTLKALFQKDVRYVIPMFQRPYVWDQDGQGEALWDDLRNVAEWYLDELQLERGHHTITSRGKRGKILKRTLPPVLHASIVELLDGRASGAILTRVRSGNALDRFDAAKIVSRLAAAAGIEKRISPHSLRHTAVTLYLDAGAELRDVSDAMGHASPSTTMRYDRARRSLERDPAYRLELALAE